MKFEEYFTDGKTKIEAIRFPKNEYQRNLWLNACGLQADECLPSRLLCSRHFEDTCYTKCGYRLKSNAIPTKFLKGQVIRPYFQLPEYKNIHLRLKNDGLSSSLQPSTSETVNVSSKLKQGRNLTNIYTAKEPSKYCTCKEEKGGKSIMCTQENCPNLWYHYVCLGIKRKPRSEKWKCKFCK
ncbi:chromatin modification-related protein png2-like isoform X2 [Acyrthosiphon pisum]|uniref:THAP-type domain-containing protein n=1 Tax=Acyrthosiphon pisum TaxID=7029 RepID=A0A8R2JV98_ACYPI|nr:chromatin modification-related protein png2-like isoform X2 [Acyrthosiphon pisum]